ncbi:MAG: PASTA domain-containing protein [Bacteroidota bacterium]|nr:PASTA domain-containing protein [Bacteroidota bacterium]
MKNKSFFLIQLPLAILIVVALVMGFSKWLNYYTNHGEQIIVPDLSKLTVVEAEQKLKNLNLNYQINDTLSYDKNFPPNAIVEQDPTPNSTVKSGRKIYLKLNAATYNLVEVPDYKELTFRQVLPTLKALGFEEGSKTYKPYFAEDVVLELTYKGKKLRPGDKVKKTSRIDFVLGDGKTVFLTDNDTLQNKITTDGE